MPHVLPITDDVATALAAALPAARALAEVDADADARTTLAALESLLEERRASARELAPDEIIGLGVLLGDAYVRELGWAWVQLDYGDAGTAFATVDAAHRYGNQPLNWVNEIATDPDREIALMLAFEMIVAGELPEPGADGPLIVH